MTTLPPHLRLDPWSADYESALQLPAAEEPEARVDVTVECARWAALRPAPATPGRLRFVDGVRRVDQRLLLEEPGGPYFGLLGSLAVGLVEADGDRAGLTEARVQRHICVGGGRLLPAFEAPLRSGRQALAFEPLAVPENTPQAPVEGLQAEMRREEARLATELARDGDPVILDGPLGFVVDAAAPIVGFVKRLLRSYLGPGEAALLPELEVGQRTPLFLLSGNRHARYSWYQRVGRGRSIDARLHGVVRLEADAGLGLDATRAVADRLAADLPRFASDARHDPRAPQNLFPVGGLEARLRHLLGDPLLVRRAIEARVGAGLPA